MPKKSDDFSMRDAMHLAQTDEAKELLALLREKNPQQLQQAMDQASSGDYAQVKQTLSDLLASPQVQELIKRMGR